MGLSRVLLFSLSFGLLLVLGALLAGLLGLILVLLGSFGHRFRGRLDLFLVEELVAVGIDSREDALHPLGGLGLRDASIAIFIMLHPTLDDGFWAGGGRQLPADLDHLARSSLSPIR